MMSETLESAALEYLKLGLTVIPIRGRYGKTLDEAKKPLVNWQKWQGLKPSEETVNRWFVQKPMADIGLLTGPSNGLLALDIDGQRGYQSIADRPIPDTWVNVTRRGEHYLFTWDARLNDVATTKVGIFPGVDVRGKGGYIIAPPSVGVGDFQYKWKEGCSPSERKLAAPPEWLVQELCKTVNLQPSDYVEVKQQDNWLITLKEGLAEGENRHNGMCKLASYYMSRGIPEDDVITLMHTWNLKCRPPKDEHEFDAKLRDFLRNWETGRYRSSFKQQTKLTVQSSKDFISQGPTEVNWLVKDLIPAETIGFLHGYGGLGKSWMSLDLAIEIGRGGGAWLGHFATKGGKVLYIDEESHPTLLRQRYLRLLQTKGLTPEKVDVSFLSQQGLKFDDKDSFDTFKGLLMEIRPTLIIIDPFVAIHGLNENSKQDMASLREVFKDLIRDCQVGLFFIDHERKPSEMQVSAAQRQTGSQEKDAVADVKIALSKKNGKLLVEHAKARYNSQVNDFYVELNGTDNIRVEYKKVTDAE